MTFDFSSFPVLTTPRLVLREMTVEDAADFFVFASDPEGQKYDSDPPLGQLAEALQIIEENHQRFLAKKSINWGITLVEEQRVIGNIGFYFYHQEYYKVDLGYTVARPYWRKGVATEALGAVVKFAFETIGVHRINVDTRMDNLASLGLMRAAGFQYEGARRECVRNADGTYQTWGLFGMLAHEYRKLAEQAGGA